jgi:hypothetical protein
MKLVMRLGIAISLPLIAVLAFALATNRGEIPPERARLLLNEYLARTRHSGQPARVLQIVPAAYPTGLTGELSAYSLGYGAYYTTLDYVSRPVITVVPTARPFVDAPPSPTPYTSELMKLPGLALYGKPLPYPPTYASCVLIERGHRYEVVILAQHQDMYTADWVLHTTELTPQAAARALACALDWPK